MEYPQCTVANLALPFQVTFNILSFAFALATVILILKHKLYRNSFAFVLLITQVCYLLISSIDLLTKFTTFNDAYIVWCKVVSPIIYGAIIASFLLIELFVVMVYKTILDGGQGWLYQNVRIITFVIMALCIAINCVGIPYYGLGFCNSCGFNPVGEGPKVKFATYVILGDFYLPMVLMIPVFVLIFHLMCKKKRELFMQSEDSGCKILTIPIINFIILTISGTTGYIKNVSPVVFTILFESIYLVSIINFIFYRCFTKFFELEEKNTNSSRCCGKTCFSQQKINRDTELTYFYDDKKSTYQ